MEPLSEQEILRALDGTPDDIVLPDLTKVQWELLDYFGWIHPSGQLGYIVVISPDDGSVRGAVLRRSRFSGSKPGVEMCSLCHHVHRPSGTALFTMMDKDPDLHRTIGNIVCKDLDCSLRVRNIKGPSGFLNETLYPEAKIWRMQLAVHKWLRGANRL